MTSDHRITADLIHDIVDALDRHGYSRGNDLHNGRAIGLTGDRAGICEGTQDHPSGPSVTHPPREAGPVPPGSATWAIVVLSPGDVRTIAALDDASVRKRDRAATCIDCDDRSSNSCQWRLHVTGTDDLLAAGRDDTARAWRAVTRPSSARQPEPAAGWEAGP